MTQILKDARRCNPRLKGKAMKKARVIRDEAYPKMHRVRWPGGELSDLGEPVAGQ